MPPLRLHYGKPQAEIRTRYGRSRLTIKPHHTFIAIGREIKHIYVLELTHQFKKKTLRMFDRNN